MHHLEPSTGTTTTANGNIAATTKAQAQSDHSYRYDEYGIVLPETNGSNNWTDAHNNYTLTQKEFDPNTDLTYFGARYYDADTGTWMTQDSYRGELTNPMSLQRYQYNFNSPINYRDLYGFNPVGEFFGGLGDAAKSWGGTLVNGAQTIVSVQTAIENGEVWAITHPADAVETAKTSIQNAAVTTLNDTRTAITYTEDITGANGAERQSTAVQNTRQTVGDFTTGTINGVKEFGTYAIEACRENPARCAGRITGEAALTVGVTVLSGGSGTVAAATKVGTGIMFVGAGKNIINNYAQCTNAECAGRVTGEIIPPLAAYSAVSITASTAICPNTEDLPVLEVSKTKTPAIAQNIENAIKDGQPSILNRVTDQVVIRANRNAALQGIIGISPDEYPFASTQQGGAGASVKIVPLWEQQIQGGQLSSFYQKYNIQDGDPFVVKIVK